MTMSCLHETPKTLNPNPTPLEGTQSSGFKALLGPIKLQLSIRRLVSVLTKMNAALLAEQLVYSQAPRPLHSARLLRDLHNWVVSTGGFKKKGGSS